MWRRKKLVIVAVLAAVVLVGSIGGIALANGADDRPEAPCTELLDRVSEIYEQKTGVTIDPDVLKEALDQARGEMHPEGMPYHSKMDPEALQNHLQDLLNDGEITEEQYEHMMDRIESMPDNLPGFGFRGHGGFRGFGGPCFTAE